MKYHEQPQAEQPTGLNFARSCDFLLSGSTSHIINAVYKKRNRAFELPCSVFICVAKLALLPLQRPLANDSITSKLGRKPQISAFYHRVRGGYYHQRGAADAKRTKYKITG